MKNLSNMLNQEELKNISALIKVAPINGGQALIVASLLAKIESLLTNEQTNVPQEDK